MRDIEIIELSGANVFPTTVIFVVNKGNERKILAVKGLMYIRLETSNNVYIETNGAIEIIIRADKEDLIFEFGETWVTAKITHKY